MVEVCFSLLCDALACPRSPEVWPLNGIAADIEENPVTAALMSNWGVVPRDGPGLCATCTHVETIRSDRGSTFFRCALSDIDARFPKYPALPVLECIGWVPGSGRQPERLSIKRQVEE